MITYLRVENASRNWGEVKMFSNLSFCINEGDKVAIVARNGTGKTTLLNIIAGKDSFDSGGFYINKDIKVGYLEQNPRFDSTLTLFDAVYGSPGKLMETVRDYELALHEHNQQSLHDASAMMDFHQAWNLENKIRQMLSVFKLEDESMLVGSLSGGQVKRLALVVALISEPDFVMLDEPTNHLDLEMIEWLEEYLLKSRITMLVVTHDRYFLDRVCNEIIEIDGGAAYTYMGNYSEFIQKRAERITNKEMQVERAQNLLRKELEWMRRMPKARGTKAKYRIDAFYELKTVSEYRRNDQQVNIQVKESRLGKKILLLHGVRKKFGEKVILDGFTYSFARGERIGIIGQNGTGKSTLLNIITGLIPADSGEIEQGETVIFGYYQQKGLEFLPGKRVIDIIQDIAEYIDLGNGQQMSAMQFLNQFLFTPEMQHIQVEKLSGGERRRLYLMTVLIRNPNFLILDEPTNDLDIATLHVLEEYLINFAGCVLIVSHDRFFMDKIVDHTFIFEGNGTVYDFPGNYSDYRASQKKQAAELKQSELPEKNKTNTAGNQVNPNTAKKKPTFKEKREFEQLTAELESLENEKKSLEVLLGNGNLASEDLVKHASRIAEIITLIDQKTDRWLQLSEVAG